MRNYKRYIHILLSWIVSNSSLYLTEVDKLAKNLRFICTELQDKFNGCFRFERQPFTLQ